MEMFFIFYLLVLFFAAVGVILNGYEAIYSYFTGPTFGYDYGHYAKWALICLAIVLACIAPVIIESI